MKKALPLTLVLIGAALVITAVIFWIDSSTSTEPQTFGQSLRDWITLILGIGASLKGWLDLFKPDIPTPPTTQFTIEDGNPQISTGDHARNIQAQTYIENQYIQQPPEPKTPKSLNQLPAPPLDFIGREKELTQLRQNIKNGVLISGVQGMGGIGKTALGLKLAEQIAPNYPDGQIYIDLRGAHEQTPLTPEQVMAYVIRSFHPETALPIDFSELGALYRSTLNGKKTLLFYDNARDENQLRSLLPPKSCVLFVTSRQYFTLPGLVAIDLETLTSTEAIELVQEIAPKVIGKDAETLVSQCGYLPLAIRAAVSVLLLRPDWSASDLIKRLTDNKEKLGLVESSLSLSYEALDTDLQKYLRQLSIFAAPFDKEAIMAIWGIESSVSIPPPFVDHKELSKKSSDQKADDTLGYLLKTSLLKFNTNSDEYYFHDLTHLFLQNKLLQGDRSDEVLSRYAEYYLKLAVQIQSKYLEGGDFVVTSIAHFRRIWIHLHNISTRLSPSLKSIWNRPLSSDEWLSESIESIQTILSLCITPKEYIPFANRALSAAERQGENIKKGGYLIFIGFSYFALGDTQNAVECYEKALYLGKEIGSKEIEGNALMNLGTVSTALGDSSKAIKYYEQGLNIGHNIGMEGNGMSFANLGNAYLSIGDTKKAIETYRHALDIARNSGDKQAEAGILGSLGFIKISDNKSNSPENIQTALRIAQEVGDKRTEAYMLSAMAGAKREQGEIHESIALNGQALLLSDEIGDTYAKSQILDNMANAYADLGDYEKAIENYLGAIEYAKTVGDDELVANIVWNLATVYNEQEQYELAAQNMQITVDFEQKINHPNAIADLEALNEVRAKIQNTTKPEEES